MRAPNTVDFWRGFALLEIVVNHIPDDGQTRLTHSQYSWSDAAELFVFLAGWAFARRLHRRGAGGMADVFAFTGQRFAKIWLGQVVTALLVTCLYLHAARYAGDAAILADNRAGLAATDPLSWLAGVLVLGQQPRFVDILPLYAVLTIATPLIFIVNRRSTALLVALSGALFMISLIWRPRLPTWPEAGHWFFEPLSWQAMFVAGFVIGQRRDFVDRLVARAPAVIPVACFLVAFSVLATVAGWTPPAEPPPDSLASHVFGKSALGLLPLPQFLALALVVSRVTRVIPRFLPPLWKLLSLLGRNSLSVFCAGTFISAIGQVCHRAGLRGAIFDVLFAAAAALVLCAVAKLREAARESARKPPAEAAVAGFSAPADQARA